MYNLPGETDDHLVVWLPEERTLLPGDNIYENFPNIYTIRGFKARDARAWARSLSFMISLRPLHLVPSHTDPVVGEQAIKDVLTLYKEGIMFVHDQTVRYINKDLHPTEIAQLVKLPPGLASSDYMSPVYGTPEWSVKSIYNQYVGWFSGDPVDLSPLTPAIRASKMVDWLGKQSIIDEAWKALQEGEPQWALELASHIFKVDPGHRDALEIRSVAMKMLATSQTSTNGRHYYLSCMYEDHKLRDWEPLVKTMPKLLMVQAMDLIFAALKYRVKAEDKAVQDMDIAVDFVFPDTGEQYCLKLRNAVLDIKEDCDLNNNPDILVNTTSVIWREILSKKRSALASYATGEFSVQGGMWKFKSFMDCFDTS